MKILLGVLLLAGVACGQMEVVPQRVLTAKTAAVEVYWPNSNSADAREVQYEGEHFLKKWKRYQIAPETEADLVVFICVEPMTVYPGFWQRVAWVQNVQQFGAAEAAPLMFPSTVLTGSILLYDGKELADWITQGAPQASKPTPIMYAPGEGNRKPLLTAGKKLRKMIDSAVTSSSPRQ